MCGGRESVRGWGGEGGVCVCVCRGSERVCVYVCK